MFFSQTGQYGQESIFIQALESVCIIHGDSSTATGTAPQHRRGRHGRGGEWRAQAACADRRILGDGLLMRSDIMVVERLLG